MISKTLSFFSGNDVFVFFFSQRSAIHSYVFLCSVSQLDLSWYNYRYYVHIKDSLFFMGMMCLCCSFPKEEVPYILMYFHILDWVELHPSPL